jgi:hypothetical protein
MLLSLIFTIIFIFIQGDEEKRQGIQPQSLMDRSLAHELPKNQVKEILGKYLYMENYEIMSFIVCVFQSTPYLENSTDIISREKCPEMIIYEYLIP